MSIPNTGQPYTTMMPQFSPIKTPDFNVPLQLGNSPTFSQGFSLPQPRIGETQPQTQAEWSQQQISDRLNRQGEDFRQNLQNIISPPTQGLDVTKFGLPDYAQQFADKTAPLLSQMKLKTGFALQGSSDPGTQLLGRMQTDEAMRDLKKPLSAGTSTINEKSLSQKFSDSTFGKNYGMWSAGIGLADSIFTGIAGEKSEYAGPKGDLTRSIDGAYDSIQQLAGNFGPIGQMVSLGMGANKLLGNVANKLGGGTDGMTTTDAIMGSAFMQLTPFGLINGFGGEKASTITKDDAAFETVGSSYSGTSSTVDDALTKSGKKYGLFSSGSREKANREIEEAKRQQAVMTDIADEATDRFNIRNSMAAINGNRRAFAMQGGYNQSAIRAGRNGMPLRLVYAAKRVVSKYNLTRTKEQPIEEFKQGGILEISLNSIPEEFLEPSIINEVRLDSILPEFKEGGKVNVIPEGALHARLHHMENADNLTKKGIPVVSEKEGGDLEQQAEIEREEIIFRLEVTKKLEELSKDGSDEAAIEAGKLLTEEILNNTIDNTNNLL